MLSKTCRVIWNIGIEKMISVVCSDKNWACEKHSLYTMKVGFCNRIFEIEGDSSQTDEPATQITGCTSTDSAYDKGSFVCSRCQRRFILKLLSNLSFASLPPPSDTSVRLNFNPFLYRHLVNSCIYHVLLFSRAQCNVKIQLKAASRNRYLHLMATNLTIFFIFDFYFFRNLN